jgi:hypothetical protein
LVVTGLVAVTPAGAQNLLGNTTSGLFGFKVGLISRMDLRSTPPLSSEIGSTAQVFAYFPAGRRYYWTTAFDFYYIQIVNSNQVMIEPNIGINKSFLLKRSQLTLVPGASIGFTFLADMGSIPASQYLSFKLSVEVHGIVNARQAWIGELAIFHAPMGSGGGDDLSFGPGLMARLGLAFR